MTMSRPAFLAFLATAVIAQQNIPSNEARLRSNPYWPRSQTVLRAESKLVEAGVVVRDQSGRPVGGLTKEDFEIEESGKTRPIVAFTAEVSHPAPSGNRISRNQTGHSRTPRERTGSGNCGQNFAAVHRNLLR